MTATFLDRLTAYAIDILIVGLIISLICIPLPNRSSEVSDEINELANKYATNEINETTLMDEYEEILYSNQKKEFPRLVVDFVITFAYFVVFQYLNKGKTIGKSLMKLQVVDNETDKPISILRGFIRSLFVLGILSSITRVIGIKFLPRELYSVAYSFITLGEYVFIISSLLLILSKQGKGLHDIITGTKVIKERRG